MAIVERGIWMTPIWTDGKNTATVLRQTTVAARLLPLHPKLST